MVLTTICLPTRPQPDTIVAIYLLKKYGIKVFPGIDHCGYQILSRLEEGKTEKDYLREGMLLIDVGGGIFDHHTKSEKTTASALVAEAFGIQSNKSIEKLLEYAKRDDFFGKGTVSDDPLDRAFGLSGLIAALNKTKPDNIGAVIEIVLPLIAAHHEQEEQRHFEIPKEVDELKAAGKFQETKVLQKKNELKVCFVESDNVQLPGYLRAADGGKYDVVVQRRSTGHVNILTRPLKRPDIRPVAELIRAKEYELTHGSALPDTGIFRLSGRNEDVAAWYFDPATNSLQNGGINPGGVAPTAIPWNELKAMIPEALSKAV